MQTQLLSLISIACFLSTISSSGSSAASLLDCKALDYVTMTSDGHLESGNKGVFLKLEQFIIDIDTGMVRHKTGERNIWQIIQKGNSASDTVLIAPSYGPPRKTIDATITDYVIRIRRWADQKQITFWKSAGTGVTTGTCTILH
jgi:hypothetical protein